MNKRKKKLLTTLCALLLAGSLAAGGAWYMLFAPQFHPAKTAYLLIDRDDTMDSVCYKLKLVAAPSSLAGFQWMAKLRDYGQHVRTGRYAVQPGDNAYDVFNRLYRGQQTPLNLTIGSVRSMDRLAANIGRQLMIDSTEIAQALNDTLCLRKLGYDKATIYALFIPDTYQVYWNINVDGLLQRMVKEHARFWNKERLAKAQAAGLTVNEVCTLASIVEEETNNSSEKPIVAGLYINRLRRGIPLQADPTVRFALGDFTRQRITNADLKTPSPYNTYLNPGLPPGPIRIPTPRGIDAVLNYAKHNYIYMCAKEDFSGTHNFASNHHDHLRNARKYWNALNARKIYR